MFAASKVIRLDLPQLSGLDGRRGIALLENVLGRLTQGNRISRLDLLNLALACGNLFGTMHRFTLREGQVSDPSAVFEDLPRQYVLPISRHAPRRSPKAFGTPVKKIPGSARYEHDKKRESTGGNPPSGHEKPELPCPVLFTPRSSQQNPSGARWSSENKSWNYACI